MAIESLEVAPPAANISAQIRSILQSRRWSLADFEHNNIILTGERTSAAFDKNRHDPTVSNLLKICDALRVSPDVLLEQEKDNPSLDDEIFSALYEISQWSDEEIHEASAKLWTKLEEINPASAQERIITPPRPLEYRISSKLRYKKTWQNRRK